MSLNFARSGAAMLTAAAMGGSVTGGEPPTLETLLARTGAYVQEYESAFRVIIADETYEQVVTTIAPSQRGLRLPTIIRDIHSEMAFVSLPEPVRWLGVRHVLRYRDNRSGRWVSPADSDTRIDAILKDALSGSPQRLRRLADEGARFNVGTTVRNFASPTLAIQFVDPAFRERFAFTAAGLDHIRTVGEVERIAFAERGSPTIVQTGQDDLPATGTIWVRTSDGTVARTRLDLVAPAKAGVAAVHSRTEVDYRPHAALGLWVPTQMRETYQDRSAVAERIECFAAYTNFRRFETRARILPPK